MQAIIDEIVTDGSQSVDSFAESDYSVSLKFGSSRLASRCSAAIVAGLAGECDRRRQRRSSGVVGMFWKNSHNDWYIKRGQVTAIAMMNRIYCRTIKSAAAKKVGLPARKTLDLGGGIKMAC